MDWTKTEAPSLEAFQALADAARAALPGDYARAAAAVALRVEDMPDDRMLAELEMDSPWDLTGLYDGIPLTEKSVMDQPHGPDTVWLFRLPILLEWMERGNVGLGDLVGHVLVHEFAHHFGWSDDDIATIDRWWE